MSVSQKISPGVRIPKETYTIRAQVGASCNYLDFFFNHQDVTRVDLSDSSFYEKQNNSLNLISKNYFIISISSTFNKKNSAASCSSNLTKNFSFTKHQYQ